jgi:methyl-accepting chemotaxis protein
MDVKPKAGLVPTAISGVVVVMLTSLAHLTWLTMLVGLAAIAMLLAASRRPAAATVESAAHGQIKVWKAAVEPEPVFVGPAPSLVAASVPELPAHVCVTPAYSEERVRTVAAELGSAAALTEILRAQLCSVKTDTEDAINRVADRLLRIDTVIQTILLSVRESAKVSECLVQLSQNEAFTKLLQMGSAATYASSANEDDMRAGIETTKHLFGFIAELRDVAEQTNILALNASIEASRAGPGGATFAVIGREIRSLSDRSKELAKRIEAGVQTTITSLEAHFAELLSRSAANQKRIQATITEELAGLTMNLSTLLETQGKTIHDVQTHSEEIAELVRELVTNLQIQDITRHQVESVVMALSALDTHHMSVQAYLLGSKAGEDAPRVQSLLDAMSASYVTETQREIYAGIAGTPVSTSASSMVELF